MNPCLHHEATRAIQSVRVKFNALKEMLADWKGVIQGLNLLVYPRIEDPVSSSLVLNHFLTVLSINMSINYTTRTVCWSLRELSRTEWRTTNLFGVPINIQTITKLSIREIVWKFYPKLEGRLDNREKFVIWTL